jgi:hypothetical protein
VVMVTVRTLAVSPSPNAFKAGVRWRNKRCAEAGAELEGTPQASACFSSKPIGCGETTPSPQAPLTARLNQKAPFP